jgi:tRNA-dihydrouridine synthase A
VSSDIFLLNQQPAPWRLSVAPMMDWTDRHCRYFHRQLTRHARLYTEMVTTGALLHGHVPRHLDFNLEEHPVALQLGGSEPADLAACAKLAQQWGYDEVNLNCGCPSERVQRGAFGACLMNEAPLVAEGVKAMLDATGGNATMPITVKHRIGIDQTESYDFVRDFVGTIADAGCEVFMVHARNAWLKGLSPKENREVPPLRYEFVHRLKRDFPHLTIVLNGGVADNALIAEQLRPGAVYEGVTLDGVMVGRAAYHQPWMMADWDALFYGDDHFGTDRRREDLEAIMVAYCEREMARTQGMEGAAVRWPSVIRHILGLYNGLPGARRWRQVWSDHQLKGLPPSEVMALAHQRPH